MTSRLKIVLTLPLAMFVLALIIPGHARAASITIKPSADAGFVQQNPDTNDGDGVYFDLGHNNSVNYTTGGLIKFDMPVAIPSEAVINSATLQLQVFGNDCAINPISVIFGTANSSWSESNLSWSNKPGYSNSINASLTCTRPATSGTVDLTSYVKKWVNQGITNYGIEVLPGGDNYYWDVYISTREEPAKAPTLTIDYTIPAAPAESTANPTTPANASNAGAPQTGSASNSSGSGGSPSASSGATAQSAAGTGSIVPASSTSMATPVTAVPEAKGASQKAKDFLSDNYTWIIIIVALIAVFVLVVIYVSKRNKKALALSKPAPNSEPKVEAEDKTNELQSLK